MKMLAVKIELVMMVVVDDDKTLEETANHVHALADEVISDSEANQESYATQLVTHKLFEYEMEPDPVALGEDKWDYTAYDAWWTRVTDDCASLLTKDEEGD